MLKLVFLSSTPILQIQEADNGNSGVYGEHIFTEDILSTSHGRQEQHSICGGVELQRRVSLQATDRIVQSSPCMEG